MIIFASFWPTPCLLNQLHYIYLSHGVIRSSFWLRARNYKGDIRVVLHSACCYYDGVAAPLCTISKTKIEWNTAFSYVAHNNVCLTHEMNLLDKYFKHGYCS